MAHPLYYKPDECLPVKTQDPTQEDRIKTLEAHVADLTEDCKMLWKYIDELKEQNEVMKITMSTMQRTIDLWPSTKEERERIELVERKVDRLERRRMLQFGDLGEELTSFKAASWKTSTDVSSSSQTHAASTVVPIQPAMPPQGSAPKNTVDLTNLEKNAASGCWVAQQKLALLAKQTSRLENKYPDVEPVSHTNYFSAYKEIMKQKK